MKQEHEMLNMDQDRQREDSEWNKMRTDGFSHGQHQQPNPAMLVVRNIIHLVAIAVEVKTTTIVMVNTVLETLF